MQLFLKFELTKIAKYYKTKSLAKIITTLLFFAVFFFIGSGIYFFFLSGFRYINVEAVDDIRLALTLFLYEVFLLVLAAIIIFSTMVSGVFSLFKGDRNAWLLSSPTYKLLPKVVFLRSFLTSLLPTLIMFLPAVLAFNKVYDLGALSLFFIIFSVILLLIVLNTVTLLSVLLIGSAYYKLSRTFTKIHFNFKSFVAILVLIVVTDLLFVWKMIAQVDLVQVFKADIASDVLSVSNIASYFYLLPTHPLAMEILYWQNMQPLQALENVLILGLLAALFLTLWWKVSPLFYPLWQKFQDGTSVPTSTKNGTISKVASFQFTGGRTLALFKKELLISSRNYKGVLWFLFLLFIWLAQVGTNVIVGNSIARHQVDVSQKVAILQALQFIIAIYFMSAFALRFVFPSFSVERRTAWILASAPLSFRRIFFGKYIFYITFFVALGILMSAINTIVLTVPFINAFYSGVLFMTTVIFIVTLAMSLGAIFPNLESDDPEVISTSMPGLFFTALALIYGAFSSLVLYTALTQGSNYWLLSYSIFTLILVLLLLLKTPSFARR